MSTEYEAQQAGIKALKNRIRELEEEITFLVTEIGDREKWYEELRDEFGVYKMNHPDDDRDKGSDG